MTQLAPNRFELSINGMRHNVFRAIPELGTPIDALLDPAYWAHVSAKMAEGDEVRVFAEDRSYFVELIVRDVGTLYAKVAMKAKPLEFGIKDAVDTPAGYKITWGGPAQKYRVVRGDDVLKFGFVDKTEAGVWLDGLLKKAAA